jgi:hypothetical protein
MYSAVGYFAFLKAQLYSDKGFLPRQWFFLLQKRRNLKSDGQVDFSWRLDKNKVYAMGV